MIAQQIGLRPDYAFYRNYNRVVVKRNIRDRGILV